MWSVFGWKNSNKIENHFAESNFGEARWLMCLSYNCHKSSIFNDLHYMTGDLDS